MERQEQDPKPEESAAFEDLLREHRQRFGDEALEDKKRPVTNGPRPDRKKRKGSAA